MNVIIGDWSITSDSNCFILKEKKVAGPQSKTPGKEAWKVKGYYVEVEHAVARLINGEIMRSDAKSLKDVIDVIKETKAMISESLNVQGG